MVFLTSTLLLGSLAIGCKALSDHLLWRPNVERYSEAVSDIEKKNGP